MAARQRVLVTGGAGFIGSALTKLLLKKGCHVTVLDDLSFGRKGHVWTGIRFVCGDIRSLRTLRRTLARPFDTVFHLAAIHFIPYCNTHPREAISINVEGTWTLLEALRGCPPQRLFFASTAAVYDTGSRPHRVSEIPAPMDIYGTTKLTGEHLVRQFWIDSGVRCAIGRLFNAYGPCETNAHLIPHILAQLAKGRHTLRLGNLSPFRDYIHTSDMTRAIYLLAQKAPRKALAIANIASGDEYSVREVVEVFGKELGRRLSVESHRTLRRRQERKHLRGDLRDLRRWTGFRPRISFNAGVRQLLEEEGLIGS